MAPTAVAEAVAVAKPTVTPRAGPVDGVEQTNHHAWPEWHQKAQTPLPTTAQ